MRTLCGEISHSLPFAVRINRGKLSLEGIAEKSVEYDAEKVMIIERWKFGLGRIQLFNLKPEGLESVPPTIYVRNAIFRRNLAGEIMKERRIKSIAIAASPHENSEVEKLEKALSDFFEIPVFSLKEAINKKCDAAMQIKTSSQKDLIITFMLLPELVEVGPQILVSHIGNPKNFRNI
jgi:rRNA maturation protein Rpf1